MLGAIVLYAFMVHLSIMAFTCLAYHRYTKLVMIKMIAVVGDKIIFVAII